MNNLLLNWEPSNVFGKSFLSQFFDLDKQSTSFNYVPQSDVYENESSWFFKMSTPGVNQEDIRVTVENNILTVRGETKSEILDQTTRIYRSELRYGSFNRSFRLPDNVIPEQATAKVENGIIVVEVPKQKDESDKPKALEIPINVKSLE